MSNEETILVSRDGFVATVTLNRPAKLNALTKAMWGALAGIAVGIALVLAEKFLPKKVLRFVPSPSGLGIAFVIPGYNSIAMFSSELLLSERPASTTDRGIP